MDLRQEILAIPSALRETLEKGRAEYEALVRRTRWGEVPVFIVSEPSSLPAALTAAYAFESLIGWPAVARTAADFSAYSLGVLRPRSVVLAICQPAVSGEMLEVARIARSRGAILLALTDDPQSPLAKLADGAFLLRVGGEPGRGWKRAVCEHAALGSIALVAAQALKRPQPQFEALAADFERLPADAEWVMTQLPDAVRSLADELKGLRQLYVVGGGFYYPAALQWSRLFGEESAIITQCFPPQEFITKSPERLGPDAAVLFLSSSRCRLKKGVGQLASVARQAGVKILSVTDANDRELADRSMLAVLLPLLSEMVGATLTLALLAWVTYNALPERAAHRRRVPRSPRS